MYKSRHLITKKEILWHLLAWIIYILWAQQRIFITWNSEYVFLPIVVSHILYAFIFYTVALFLLPRFFAHKKYYLFIFFTFLLWGIANISDYLIDWVWVVNAYNLKPMKMSINQYILAFSFTFIKYAFFGLGFYYLKENLYNRNKILELNNKELQQKIMLEAALSEVKEKELINEVVSLEKEKAEFEYASLRAKINPHVLFNTMHVFYGRLQKYDAEAAVQMKEYSLFMRYCIEGTGSDGLVDASEELNNVKRLIDINQFECGGSLAISYLEKGFIAGRIPAQVCITLLENALKYGELQNPAYPLTIEAETTEEDKFVFIIYNRKRGGNIAPGTGVGTRFIRKRLEHVYGDAETMKIIDGPDQYYVQLTLDI